MSPTGRPHPSQSPIRCPSLSACSPIVYPPIHSDALGWHTVLDGRFLLRDRESHPAAWANVRDLVLRLLLQQPLRLRENRQDSLLVSYRVESLTAVLHSKVRVVSTSGSRDHTRLLAVSTHRVLPHTRVPRQEAFVSLSVGRRCWQVLSVLLYRLEWRI